MGIQMRTPVVIGAIIVAVILAGGIGCGLAVRHRHAHGTIAHSHRDSSHRHPHPHSHVHDHSRDHGDPDSREEEAESHLHVTFFGFELTLPDFSGREPAPLVTEASDCDSVEVAGDVLTLPGAPNWRTLIQFASGWLAIAALHVRTTLVAHSCEYLLFGDDPGFPAEAALPLDQPPDAV